MLLFFSGQIPSIDQIHTPRSLVRGRSDGDRNVLAQGSLPKQLFMFSCSTASASPPPAPLIPPLALGAGSQGTIQPFNSPQREIPVSQQRLPWLQNLHFQPTLLPCVLLHSDTSVLSLSSLGSSGGVPNQLISECAEPSPSAEVTNLGSCVVLTLGSTHRDVHDHNQEAQLYPKPPSHREKGSFAMSLNLGASEGSSTSM